MPRKQKQKPLMGGDFMVVASNEPPASHDPEKWGPGYKVLAPLAFGNRHAAPLLVFKSDAAAYDPEFRKLVYAVSAIPELLAACEKAQSLAYSILNTDDPKVAKMCAQRMWAAAYKANVKASPVNKKKPRPYKKPPTRKAPAGV